MPYYGIISYIKDKNLQINFNIYVSFHDQKLNIKHVLIFPKSVTNISYKN